MAAGTQACCPPLRRAARRSLCARGNDGYAATALLVVQLFDAGDVGDICQALQAQQGSFAWSPGCLPAGRDIHRVVRHRRFGHPPGRVPLSNLPTSTVGDVSVERVGATNWQIRRSAGQIPTQSRPQRSNRENLSMILSQGLSRQLYRWFLSAALIPGPFFQSLIRYSTLRV